MQTLAATSLEPNWQPNPSLAALKPVQQDELRAGMRHLAAPVSIVTTVNGLTRAGLTVTAVTSVTAEPPRLVVFINKNTFAAEHILSSGLLCVNVLTAEQQELACIFAGMRKEVPGEQRFNHGEWHSLLSGAPVLANAKVNFDCRVIKVYGESTHHAFLCEVLATQQHAAASPLLYLDSDFHTLSI